MYYKTISYSKSYRLNKRGERKAVKENVFSVVLGQDPRLILDEHHAKSVVNTRLIQEFGAQALKKASIRQGTRVDDGFLETQAKVVIMSMLEMQAIEVYVNSLKMQLKELQTLRTIGEGHFK